MNNRIENIFILSIVVSLFLAACGDKSTESGKTITTENGFDLTIIEDKSGPTPEEGEGLKISVSIYADDSLVQYVPSEDMGIQLMMPDSMITQQKDPVYDSFRHLSAGDSASVKQRVEDLPAALQSRVPNAEFLYYNIVLEDILSLEEIEAEKEKARAEQEEQQRVNQALIAERTVFLDEMTPQLNKIVEDYKNGRLEVRKLGAGLELYMINDGGGEEINSGDEVDVDYIGRTLAAEKVFDSSFSRPSGLPLTIGSGQVIPGWELALAELKRGDEAVVFIPSELAYKDKAHGNDIPANSDLVFYVKPQ